MKTLIQIIQGLSRLIVTAFIASVTGMVVAGEITTELQAVVSIAAPDEDIPVIIRFVDNVDKNKLKKLNRNQRGKAMIEELQTQASAHKNRIRRLLKQLGQHAEVRDLWIANAIAAKVPAGWVDYIGQLPGVVRISLDATINAPHHRRHPR